MHIEKAPPEIAATTAPARGWSRSCVLLWSGVVLILVAVLAGLILPWRSQMTELEQRLANSTDQLQRYQRLVATLPQLKAELAALNNNDAQQVFYFQAATPALAGAQLQTRVQDIVTAAQGRLVSTQLLPAESRQDPPQVKVRTQIQGTTATLVDILRQLQQVRPLLFVERLSVRSSARADLPPPPGRLPNQLSRARPPTNPAGELTLQLDIFGLALTGARK